MCPPALGSWASVILALLSPRTNSNSGPEIRHEAQVSFATTVHPAQPQTSCWVPVQESGLLKGHVALLQPLGHSSASACLVFHKMHLSETLPAKPAKGAKSPTQRSSLPGMTEAASLVPSYPGAVPVVPEMCMRPCGSRKPSAVLTTVFQATQFSVIVFLWG